ncbi:MAG: spherulation-specific family 4 protein, partial [Nitrososphaerales archaeon]
MVSQATTSTPTGVMIPLYSYPGSDWNVVEQAKLAHPSVPIVAIINPNNGPGGSQDPNYVAGVNNLRSAGVTVLGYVY